MKKYNIQNYIRYKDDVKRSMPEDKPYVEYNRNELIVKFMPLVENLARKFPTSQQASGILSINDLIQIGNEALIRAVDKLDMDFLKTSEDVEKTLKSFLSKRIKGAVRRRIDMHRGNMRIPEHKINEIRSNPKDKKMVAMFFNSMFLSVDDQVHGDEKEYEVIRLSYGLDCEKHSAKEIAKLLNIEGVSSYVRVSELKKQAVNKLIDNVDHSQVIDFL